MVPDTVVALLQASIPGIIVAFLTYFIIIGRDNRRDRRYDVNARSLLMHEVASNGTALSNFWNEINALDTKNHANATDHLEAMVAAGLFSHPLPHWSIIRWQQFPAQAFTALKPEELQLVDLHYRQLQGFSDLYARMVTLFPDEQEIYARDRFWTNRYADTHSALFTRVKEQASEILQNPLIRG